MNKQFALPVQLNHSKDTLSDSLGLSFYERHYVNNSVMFETIACFYLARNLFDDIKDAPCDLTTSTGVLEKAYTHIKSEKEGIYMLLTYNSLHDSILSGLYSMENDRKIKDENRNKKTQAKTDEEKIKNLLSKLSKKFSGKNPLEDIVQKVKDSNYNFEDYITLALPLDKMEEAEAAEERIREAIKKQQENPESSSEDGGGFGSFLDGLFGKDPEDED